MLLIFNYFKDLVDFILNLNRLFYKKFLEMVFISNNCSNFHQINEFQAKVT